MHTEITKAMAEAIANYNGPVKLCRPGRARGRRITPKNDAVQWLIEHCNDLRVLDQKAQANICASAVHSSNESPSVTQRSLSASMNDRHPPNLRRSALGVGRRLSVGTKLRVFVRTCGAIANGSAPFRTRLLKFDEIRRDDTMSINQRFSLNKDRYIIDSLNPANALSGYCDEGGPEDDKHLRESVLWTRLAELVNDLIIITAPMQRLSNGKTYQPFCEERYSICRALYHAILASPLNTLDVGLSLQHKFDGELRRKKRGMQDLTSLSLFVDDVECLLRGLYGESDDQAIDLARHAVRAIVEEFTKYVRNDLWREYRSAQDIDYVLRGIGLPDGYNISGSDCRAMQCAVRDLTLRARAVRANQTAFSRYTVCFVNDLYEKNWRPLGSPPEDEDTEKQLPF